MEIKTIKTRKFLPPKDDLFSLIKESFKRIKIKEKSIIVITSKIVAIWQGRCIKIDSIKKDDLIKKEADFFLDRKKVPHGYAILTIKDNILIPSAGIDESNGKGYYILWPEKPFLATKKIYNFIKKNYCLKNFGVIISDSRCVPMRRGIMGTSIAYYGFHPLRDYRGKKDIFGRKMQLSQSNIADSLASAAVIVMGEGNEQTPIAIIEDINSIKFNEFGKNNSKFLKIPIDDDIFAPLLKPIKWRPGSRTS